MKTLCIPLTGIQLLSILTLSAGEPTSLESDISEPEAISYIIGSTGAEMLTNEAQFLDVDAFLQGVSDAIHQRPSLLSETETIDSINSYAKAQHMRAQESSQKWKQANQQALKEADQSNLYVLHESGIRYRINKEGNGPTPKPEEKVAAYYTAKLIDGRQVDFTGGMVQPIKFVFNTQLPEGLRHALEMTKEGGSYHFIIPWDMAFGEGGYRGIPPHSNLLIDLNVEEIHSPNQS